VDGNDSCKDARMTDSLPRPRWLFPALFLFLAALAVPYSRKALDHRSAFVRWQSQVVQIQDSVDIATRYNYPNPPIMAIVLFPLAKLPALLVYCGVPLEAGRTTAALLWYFLKVGFTLVVFRWVFDFAADRGRPFPAWAQAAVVLLSLRPVMSDLQHGNINLFILFLVAGALAAYVRGRDFLAGVVLGLAVACKVTPALFLPYFLWKRAWKALAGAAAGLLLFLWPGVVPDFVLGHQYNQRLVAGWYDVMVHPFVFEGKVTSEHNNQSLPGLVARLATHSPSFSTYVRDIYTPTHYDNLLNLDPRQAQWIVKGCMVLFALLVVWVCRTPVPSGGPRAGWRLAAEFGIVLLGMLLFSERTWKHHCVTLIVPFAVVCYYLAACKPGLVLRGYLVASLALAAVLMATTSTGLTEEKATVQGAAKLFAKQAQVYGAFVMADLVLLAALAVLLRRQTPSAVEAAAVLPGGAQAHAA
jgi:alpha-1,2-mannosyltransferase